jgi:hypothetical protein
MDERSRAAGSMTRRTYALLRRLPLPIQDLLFWAIEKAALFLVLILVLPIVVVVFVLATVIFAAVNWAFGSPSGVLGSVLAYAWLAALIVLPIIVTVRMWRAIPILARLKRVATEGADPDGRRSDAVVPPATFVPLETRLAAADATLAPDRTAADSVAPPPTDGRSAP